LDAVSKETKADEEASKDIVEDKDTEE